MPQSARLAALLTCLAATPLAADEVAQPAAVDIELNATAPQEAGCLLSFVVQNGHAEEISAAVYEAVLFDGAGQVHQLTLFDFGSLPPARPRVRQFVLPDLACDGLSRIIFNGASTCDSAGLGAGACTDRLTLRSRTPVEVDG
jgi:hypothetical protein